MATQCAAEVLEQEIKLQVNERLYIRGIISQELYEQAKLRIVNPKSACGHKN